MKVTEGAAATRRVAPFLRDARLLTRSAADARWRPGPRTRRPPTRRTPAAPRRARRDSRRGSTSRSSMKHEAFATSRTAGRPWTARPRMASWWNMDTDETTWDKPPPPPRKHRVHQHGDQRPARRTPRASSGCSTSCASARSPTVLRRSSAARSRSSGIPRRASGRRRDTTRRAETPSRRSSARRWRRKEREMAKLKRQGAFEAEYLASATPSFQGLATWGTCRRARPPSRRPTAASRRAACRGCRSPASSRRRPTTTAPSRSSCSTSAPTCSRA